MENNLNYKREEWNANQAIIEALRRKVEFEFPNASHEKINAEIRKKFTEYKTKKIQSFYNVNTEFYTIKTIYK